MNSEPHRFNFLVLGDKKVGKTTWLTRIATGEFVKEYNSTSQSNIEELCFDTTKGRVYVFCIDCAMDEKDLTLKEDIDGYILMFSVTDKSSYKHLENWYKQIPKKPTVICGNKIDLTDDRVVKAKNTMFHLR